MYWQTDRQKEREIINKPLQVDAKHKQCQQQQQLLHAHMWFSQSMSTCGAILPTYTPLPHPPTHYTSPHFTTTSAHTFHPRWRSFIESSTASHLRSSILKLAQALLTLSLALPVPLSYCAVQSLERERAVYFLSINSWNRVSATNSMQRHIYKA